MLKNKKYITIIYAITIILLITIGIGYIYWSSKLSIQILHSIIVVFCNLLIVIAFMIVHSRNLSLKVENQNLSQMNKIVTEQEIYFRTIFEESPLGINFGDISMKILDTNKKFEQILQRSKEELSNIKWTEITHPDDIQIDLDYYKRFINREIDGYTLVKRYLRPDGTIRWVNMTIALLEVKSNKDINHICIVEDITDRIQAEEYLKESEKNYAMLLSNLPGMAYRCKNDENKSILFASEGCLTLTGYNPENLIYNHKIFFSNLIDQEYRKDHIEKWNDVLKEKSVFIGEYPIITASGETKWVHEQGQGVFNDQGELETIEGMIIDISDRKKREDEISYMSNHDSLTGLYNRRYFEEVKHQFDNKEHYPLTIIIGDINGLKLINSTMGHDKGDDLVKMAAEILRKCCREGDVLARSGGDEFSILLPNSGYEEAYDIIRKIGNLCDDYNVSNEECNISIALGCATKRNTATSLSSMIKDAEESMYRQKLLQNKSPHSSILISMKSTLFEKSQETEEHAHRLIELSKIIGKTMNLLEEQLNELELLSTLHDIGKIGISDTILNKPGKLTSSEWDEMKKHPEMGYRIAIATPELAPIADYILCHHERFDGTGYPQGLKGETIPLLSRIIAVADAYDAMTSDRSYRMAMDKEAALEELKKNAGTQFDPNIVEIFLLKLENIA